MKLKVMLNSGKFKAFAILFWMRKSSFVIIKLCVCIILQFLLEKKLFSFDSQMSRKGSESVRCRTSPRGALTFYIYLVLNGIILSSDLYDLSAIRFQFELLLYVYLIFFRDKSSSCSCNLVSIHLTYQASLINTVEPRCGGPQD